MAFGDFVQSAQVEITATSAAKAFTTNNVAGNIIIVAGRVGATGRTITITDSIGNTYALARSQVQTTDGHEMFVHYAENIGVGANTVTFAISGAAATLRVAIHEYTSDSLTGHLDQKNSAQANVTPPGSSGSVTPTVANSLFFGAGSKDDVGESWVAGGGYTLREHVTSVSHRVGTEDKISSIADDADWTMVTNANWTSLIVTFKPTAVVVGSIVVGSGRKRTYWVA